MCTVHSASMTSLRELLALFTQTQLRIHNPENTILIRYDVWLLVVIFSQRPTREASDKKRRKEMPVDE